MRQGADITAGLAFGAFGKIPALGDFFRFGLAPDFIAAWDRWLQAGIQAARAQLGPRWQDCYMTAPIWRFTLAPGLAGAAAVEGVLMASVDRVGRQFPLTLARSLPPAVDPVLSHLAGAARFEALEAVALAALDDDFGQEGLRQALAGLTPPWPRMAPTPSQSGPGSLSLCLREPAEAAATLAAALARRSFPRTAVFTALMPAGDCFFVTDGLPSSDQFYQFIDPAPCGEGEP